MKKYRIIFAALLVAAMSLAFTAQAQEENIYTCNHGELLPHNVLVKPSTLSDMLRISPELSRHNKLVNQYITLNRSNGVRKHLLDTIKTIEEVYWDDILYAHKDEVDAACVIKFLDLFPVGYYSKAAEEWLKEHLFSANPTEGILFVANISVNENPRFSEEINIQILNEAKNVVANWPLINAGDTKCFHLPIGKYYVVLQFDRSISVRDTDKKIIVDIKPNSFEILPLYSGDNNSTQTKDFKKNNTNHKAIENVRKEIEKLQEKEYKKYMETLEKRKQQFLQSNANK